MAPIPPPAHSQCFRRTTVRPATRSPFLPPPRDTAAPACIRCGRAPMLSGLAACPPRGTWRHRWCSRRWWAAMSGGWGVSGFCLSVSGGGGGESRVYGCGWLQTKVPTNQPTPANCRSPQLPAAWYRSRSRWDNNDGGNWSLAVEVAPGEGLVTGLNFNATRATVGGAAARGGGPRGDGAPVHVRPSFPRGVGVGRGAGCAFLGHLPAARLVPPPPPPARCAAP